MSAEATGSILSSIFDSSCFSTFWVLVFLIGCFVDKPLCFFVVLYVYNNMFVVSAVFANGFLFLKVILLAFWQIKFNK